MQHKQNRQAGANVKVKDKKKNRSDGNTRRKTGPEKRERRTTGLTWGNRERHRLKHTTQEGGTTKKTQMKLKGNHKRQEETHIQKMESKT